MRISYAWLMIFICALALLYFVGHSVLPFLRDMNRIGCVHWGAQDFRTHATGCCRVLLYTPHAFCLLKFTHLLHMDGSLFSFKLCYTLILLIWKNLFFFTPVCSNNADCGHFNFIHPLTLFPFRYIPLFRCTGFLSTLQVFWLIATTCCNNCGSDIIYQDRGYVPVVHTGFEYLTLFDSSDDLSSIIC